MKPLLYVYRVLLTGIHLMRTGEVNASLPECNAVTGLPYVDELIARKVENTERAVLAGADVEFHRSEYLRLSRRLAEAAEQSRLPEQATTRAALHDLLLRVRLKSAGSVPVLGDTAA